MAGRMIFTVGILGCALVACLYVSPWLAAMLATGAFVLRNA